MEERTDQQKIQCGELVSNKRKYKIYIFPEEMGKAMYEAEKQKKQPKEENHKKKSSKRNGFVRLSVGLVDKVSISKVANLTIMLSIIFLMIVLCFYNTITTCDDSTRYVISKVIDSIGNYPIFVTIQSALNWIVLKIIAVVGLVLSIMFAVGAWYSDKVTSQSINTKLIEVLSLIVAILAL